MLWKSNQRHEWIVRGSKADGDAFEAKKRLELQAAVHETRSAPEFSTLCTEKYAPFAEANFSKTTWRARSNIVATLMLFFGKKRMNTFTAADLERYKAQRLATGRLSPGSLNTELRTLRTIFRWAADHGYPVVFPKMRLLKVPRGRVRLWTMPELERLLVETQRRDPALLRMVLFLLNTGCRKGEALAAEWSWVDLERGIISIPANEVWKPKSGRAREVTISTALRAVLSGPRASSRWIFPRGDGSRFERFPDAIFKEIQTAAGVTGGAHTLRHSFASIFLKNTPDIFLLANVLGHSSTYTTQTYSHLLPEHLEKSRNSVNIGAPLRSVATPVAKRARRGEKKALFEQKKSSKTA